MNFCETLWGQQTYEAMDQAPRDSATLRTGSGRFCWALKTASAIGDDRLQKEMQGYVVPDAFTHGSAEQREPWFTTGLTAGSVASCDTFGAKQL
jgi:predicted metalloprotease